MPLEIFTFITALVRTNPAGTDGINAGDDHLRGVKQAVQDSFPAVDAACTFTPTEINSWEARIAALETGEFVGQIAAFSDTPPDLTRWILCDGSAVLRAGANAALFSMLGITYGAGDLSTTFNVPDYRGEFLRGTDAAAGNDPDAAGRTDRGDGVAGDNVGTKQLDNFASHTHDVLGDSQTGAGSTHIQVTHFQGQPPNETIPNVALSEGGNETRPRNVYVDYYIHN